MKPQQLKTNKFFYGKWPYKVLCVVPGSWRIKRSGVLPTIEYCLQDDEFEAPRFWGNPPKINKSQLMEFTNDVEPFLTRDVQIRCEGNLFNIYCKDPALFDQLCIKLGFWISKTWTPSEEVTEFYKNNSNKKILCNKLPYDLYPYKVYLKRSADSNSRESFGKWIKNYNEKIKTSPQTIKWINNNHGCWGSVYVYVKDQPTLSMVGLFLGNNVSKVEEFIPRSMINTSIDQEQPCPV